MRSEREGGGGSWAKSQKRDGWPRCEYPKLGHERERERTEIYLIR